MRIAVLGDVHANLSALRAVLDDVGLIGVDSVYCTGDVVGRGPHPNEVVSELRRLAIPTVQGNWDEAAAMDRDHTGASWESEAAEADGFHSLSWTRAGLTDESRIWLRELPFSIRFTAEERSVLLFHGSHLKQTEYLWEDRPTRYFARVAADEGDDIFCFGHSHQYFHHKVAGSHFIAVGSVGCGTPGDARARYAVIMVNGPDVAVGFRAVDYDRTSVLAAMATAGLSTDLLRIPPKEQHLAPTVTDTAAPESLPEMGGA
jgi:putative phosphoesterase